VETDTKKIGEFLEQALQRLNSELELNIRENIDGRRDISSLNTKEEEAAQTIELERRMTKARRIRQQIAEIEHAIDKLKKGTYGRCDYCGEVIPPDRLAIIPQTSYCLKCKNQQSNPVLSLSNFKRN
jgi:DnaK suppressor protein